MSWVFNGWINKVPSYSNITNNLDIPYFLNPVITRGLNPKPLENTSLSLVDKKWPRYASKTASGPPMMLAVNDG